MVKRVERSGKIFILCHPLAHPIFHNSLIFKTSIGLQGLSLILFFVEFGLYSVTIIIFFGLNHNFQNYEVTINSDNKSLE